MRNQKKCHKNKRDDEGINQGAHHPHYQTLSETDDKHQPEDQNDGHQRPGRLGHCQLVGDKALRGVGDSHRIHNQNGIDGEEIDDGKKRVLDKVHGDVLVEGVTFGYNPDKTILKDVSIFAHPGQKIALVGSTGAGKTTITNLINTFYNINKGKSL